MPTDDEVQAALDTIFDADTGIYRERGFQRRVGFGHGPRSCTTSATHGRGPATRSPAMGWTPSSLPCRP